MQSYNVTEDNAGTLYLYEVEDGIPVRMLTENNVKYDSETYEDEYGSTLQASYNVHLGADSDVIIAELDALDWDANILRHYLDNIGSAGMAYLRDQGVKLDDGDTQLSGDPS